MRRFPTTLLILLFLVSNGLFSQDTLVRFSELTFGSNLEKQILEDHFVNKKSDLFLLAMANGYSLNEAAIAKARERFYNQLQVYDTDKFRNKKNDKKIKQVYDDVHNAFLTKYELQNKFENIFNTGYYNCVSATLLYSLAFEKLGVPYHVIENPTHVYLVAFPSQESIVVETTAPMAAIFTPGDQFKQNYLKVLKEQKLISALEYSSSDTEALFNKYYFGDLKNITLEQLIGIQYQNAGIFLMDQEKNLEAMYQFEKASLFYPSERAGYLLMLATYKAFDAIEKPDTTHALCLAKLAKHKKYGIKTEAVQGEFSKVIQELLFNNNDRPALEEYYRTLIGNIADEELKKDIAFIYYYENGRMLYNQSNYKESLIYLEDVLKVKPNHQDGNLLFLNAMFRSFRNMTNTQVLTAMEQYGIKYPMLKSQALFKEAMAEAYLVEFDRQFQFNNAGEGERYRAMFERHWKENAGVAIDEFKVANAYSSAAVYYFRKGQNAKAKAIISAGLEISPENYDLKMRQKMIE